MFENRAHSFVLFIEHSASLYAITGGQGHHVIKDYKSADYGLEILSRITTLEESIIQSYGSWNFSGLILQNNSVLRRKSSLLKSQDIDKLFRTIKATMNATTLTKSLGLDETEVNNKDFTCVAKDSFQISKPLNLLQIRRLIQHLVILEKEPSKVQINPFTEIKKGSSKYLKLKAEIDEAFFEKRHVFWADEDFLIMDKEGDLGKEFQKIKFLWKHSRTPFFENYSSEFSAFEIIEHAINDHLKKKLSTERISDNISVQICKEDGTIKTRKLFELLVANVILKDGSYLLLNGNFYRFDNSLINRLNNEFKLIVKLDDELKLKPWKKNISEDAYNNLYNDVDNAYVFDKIFVNNIELCDIMMLNENSVDLIHVKKGFNHSIRTLSSQVLQAAEMLREFRDRNDRQFISGLYKSIKNKKSADTENTKLKSEKITFTEEELGNILKGRRKINFVFAFSHDGFDPNSIEKIKSTIAKLSLIDLIKNMNENIDFELKIVNIKVEE